MRAHPDDELVSLPIAARLVHSYIHSTEYVDPETTDLEGTTRRIAGVVPLIRLDGGHWAIRRGDLRTALQVLGARSL